MHRQSKHQRQDNPVKNNRGGAAIGDHTRRPVRGFAAALEKGQSEFRAFGGNYIKGTVAKLEPAEDGTLGW